MSVSRVWLLTKREWSRSLKLRFIPRLYDIYIRAQTGLAALAMASDSFPCFSSKFLSFSGSAYSDMTSSRALEHIIMDSMSLRSVSNRGGDFLLPMRPSISLSVMPTTFESPLLVWHSVTERRTLSFEWAMSILTPSLSVNLE